MQGKAGISGLRIAVLAVDFERLGVDGDVALGAEFFAETLFYAGRMLVGFV